MPKKGDIYYCCVITPGPLLFFVRFPWQVKPWRKILQALTPVMRSYGLRQKDIAGMDGYVRDDYDTEFVDSLDKAYEGDRSIIKSFDLWDWKEDGFVQVRKVEKIIIIDDGDTFEGTLEQFKDCFFSNATIETIKEWCKEKNMKVEICSR